MTTIDSALDELMTTVTVSHTVEFGTAPTLGGLLAELERFISEHPNQTSEGGRAITFELTSLGKLKSFTVTDETRAQL